MTLSLKKILMASAVTVAIVGAVSVGVAQEEKTVEPADVTAQETALTKEFLQTTELEKAFEAYLLDHGDVVLKAIENQRLKDQQEQDRQAKEAISGEADFLLKNAASPQAGNPEASITVVEFFDYNCGYCKKALSDVTGILEEDDDVRVVFKEVPILSPSSREVAKWSLAAKQQDKYFEYHQLLMNHKGQYDEETLSSMADQAGLDVEKLKKDKDKPEVDAQIDVNLAYMEKFGIRGTPSFIVGDQLVRGYVGKQGLTELINATRSAKQE